jgi:Fic family protein
METNAIENPNDLQDLLENIDALKVKLDAMRPLNAEQEARVMQKFRLDWNYHSNSIEGNSLTHGETIAFLMEGLTAKGKPLKDHLDIKGHNDAINYLMDLVKNRHELSEKDIRDLHAIILVEPYKTKARTSGGLSVEKQITLGAYKTMPNHVKTPTGEIHYYATPEETPAKMEELMAWLRDHQIKNDMHPMVLAALFHYRFVAIHPFDDGNGRMSRLLMNLLLMEDGYPPVVIKQQDRNTYYFALRQADTGDMKPFVEFIGENLVHSLEIYLRGARGESIEELDDLDKEILLLKGSLKGKEELVKLTEEVFDQNLFDVLLPFLHELEQQCSKLDDLFFLNSHTIHFLLVKMKDGVPIGQRRVFKDQNDWKLIRNTFSALNINSCKFEYKWKQFKKTDPPFDINRAIQIHFKEFNYEIIFDSLGNAKTTLRVKKTYLQPLTPEEKKQIITPFIKSVLEEIKAKTA